MGALPRHQGWLAPDAAAGAAAGVEAAVPAGGAIDPVDCGAGAAGADSLDDDGSLATTDAEGSEGSDAGALGKAAEAAALAGTTTAVAGVASGVCRLHPATSADPAINADSTQLALFTSSPGTAVTALPMQEA